MTVGAGPMLQAPQPGGKARQQNHACYATTLTTSRVKIVMTGRRTDEFFHLVVIRRLLRRKDSMHLIRVDQALFPELLHLTFAFGGAVGVDHQDVASLKLDGLLLIKSVRRVQRRYRR